MIEWKWSNGEPFERTPRRDKNNISEKQLKEQPPQQQIAEDPASMETGAYQQSLLSENDIWSIDSPQFFGENGFHRAPNKREDTYNKMSEREIMGQIGQNPFLANHNYLSDIVAQDQFLKPVSTSMEREKSPGDP